MLFYLFIFLLLLLAVICVRAASRCEHPFRAAFVSAISGGVSLVAVELFGLSIGVQTVTAAVAVLLGLPGVLMMALLKLFLK